MMLKDSIAMRWRYATTQACLLHQHTAQKNLEECCCNPSTYSCLPERHCSAPKQAGHLASLAEVPRALARAFSADPRLPLQNVTKPRADRGGEGETPGQLVLASPALAPSPSKEPEIKCHATHLDAVRWRGSSGRALSTSSGGASD